MIKIQNSKSKIQNLTHEEVKHVAKLANLELTDSEVEKFTRELSEVIDYNVGLLNLVDTTKVAPLYQVNPETNREREDSVAPSITADQALKNAGSVYNFFFKVKAVIDE